MPRQSLTLDRKAVRAAVGRGKFTASDLQAALSVSTPTLRKHLSAALDSGVVEAVGTRPTGKQGRPPVEYRVTSNPKPQRAAQPQTDADTE